jgi:hypothetical protein
MSLNLSMPYQLCRLRLRGLIERIPQSLRCRVTDFGPRIALFFHPNNRLLRPDLAAALPELGAASPLQRAFSTLTIQINTSAKSRSPRKT